MKTWLRAYRKHHSIVHACKAARKSRATVYRNRREDKRFAAAWDQISETLTDLLEASMLRRATRGVRRPVNMGENGVHYVREFSDAMAYKLLAARRPNPYNRAAGDKGQGQDPRDTATEIREWIAQMRESVPSTQPELESTPTGEAGGTAEPAA